MRMEVLLGILAAAAFTTAPIMAQPVADLPFHEDAVETYKTTPQGDLQLYIFRPAGWQASDSRPAIVFFFGGGWVSGSPKQFYPHARHLADLGMVAVSAEYRVKSKHGTSPADCIADGKSAVRWLRRHAAEQGIDPHRLAAGGGSAGGHVAAATATTYAFNDSPGDLAVSPIPDALILFNPVLDVVSHKMAAERFGADAEAGSPIHHMRKGLPPTIIFHGKADTTVPFAQAEDFCAAMKKAENQCSVIGYDGQKHGFFNYTRNPEIYRDTLEHVDKFLRKLGYVD